MKFKKQILYAMLAVSLLLAFWYVYQVTMSTPVDPMASDGGKAGYDWLRNTSAEEEE